MKRVTSVRVCDVVELECGHHLLIPHDDSNESLVGSEHECAECDQRDSIVHMIEGAV